MSYLIIAARTEIFHKCNVHSRFCGPMPLPWSEVIFWLIKDPQAVRTVKPIAKGPSRISKPWVPVKTHLQFQDQVSLRNRSVLSQGYHFSIVCVHTVSQSYFADHAKDICFLYLVPDIYFFLYKRFDPIKS